MKEEDKKFVVYQSWETVEYFKRANKIIKLKKNLKEKINSIEQKPNFIENIFKFVTKDIPINLIESRLFFKTNKNINDIIITEIDLINLMNKLEKEKYILTF